MTSTAPSRRALRGFFPRTCATGDGIALPHARNGLVGLVDQSLVVFGRTAGGLPLGSPDGRLTDLFFLVLCQDSEIHLRVLARLARLFLRPGFLDELRAEPTGHGARQLILKAEAELLGSPALAH